ncbi:MAG: D-2-hydroxyacid dehydrogenase [Lachnospiraceae bacterium]|nr:D-2-hydroxyacid dehydrogenase [Lachnospiraceae bacterium]
MKVVIMDSATVTRGDLDMDRFNKYGDVTVYELTKYEEVAERIKDADIILCNKSAMDRHNLEQAPNVKFIGLFATGYNNVDLSYTNERGITVCNAASYSTEAVAQHTFALILNKYNRVAEYNEFVKEGQWTKSRVFSPFIQMSELYGKTIGIIGYGSIGKKVADIAKVFGMKVLAYNRSKKDDEGVSFVSMDELLANSDIVTIHCPLNDESEKMCNKEFFSKMKKDAYFINTSRGGVVDEEDLVAALENDIIGGAALDVIGVEPMTEDCVLKGAKNLVITPHAAWAPVETRSRLLDIVEENIDMYLKGTPINVVTK